MPRIVAMLALARREARQRHGEAGDAGALEQQAGLAGALAVLLELVIGGVADAVGRAEHGVGAVDQLGQARERFLLAAVVMDEADAEAIGQRAVLRQQRRAIPR